MLNVVVVGAGEVGCHIASVLSAQDHNVILIDTQGKKLEHAAATIDVAFREGSGTDWQLLDDLLEFSPHFLLAMTSDDHTNLVACSIAKQLGYPRTIARVKDNRYLNRTRLDFARLFHVDHFMGPELIVANDILKYMLSPGSLAIEMFAHGAIQLRTISIPDSWPNAHVPLRDLRFPEGLMIGLIRRQLHSDQDPLTLFPHGYDLILPGDEVTLIGETDALKTGAEYFGAMHKIIDNVVIVGGSLTSLNLAKLLEHRGINIRIIEKDYERCCWLADLLPKCTIIHRDATDLEFLRSEKIGHADLLIVCTSNDELNLMIGLLGKEVGCKDTIALLTNATYGSMFTQLGINFTASPRLSAANHIVSLMLSGSVSSLVSLYENAAEIMEINVSPNSPIIGMPLSELGPLLPTDFLIAAIQNRGHVMIANGNRMISPGDTVIVLTHPKHVKQLEKLF